MRSVALFQAVEAGESCACPVQKRRRCVSGRTADLRTRLDRAIQPNRHRERGTAPAQTNSRRNSRLQILESQSSDFYSLRHLKIFYHLNSLPNPRHDIDCHRIADRFVSWTVASWFAAIWNVCPVVRKSLKSFTFSRSHATNCISFLDRSSIAVSASYGLGTFSRMNWV